ncbi:MAG: alanine/glycine:cation symporter family protein [Turicibacter sp.]
MISFLKEFEHVIWTFFAIPVLMLISILFTFYYKGVQFRFKDMIRSLTKKNSNGGISSFQSFTMALAARVGVGSLAGVALAIYIGGPGSIFWIWMSAFITAAASFAESTLAQIYKRRDGNLFVGGPAYYIQYGLNKKSFAAIYAIVIIFTYTFGFSAIQANTIATSFSQVLNIQPILTGIGLAILSSFIIFGGTQAIAKTTSKIVPIMALFYILIGIFVMFLNITYIPIFFKTIIEEAFGVNQLAGGALGITIITGIKRSVFCSEAGMGSGAHAAAISDNEFAVEQGFIQAFGVYVTTLLICTITAFLIMVTNAVSIGTPHSNGIEMTQYALTSLFGPLGGILLTVAIFFFAFSTILTGYFYGESNIKYLYNNEKLLNIVRLLVIIVIIIASCGSPSLIWTVVDIGVALTATINVIALCYLAPQVKVELRKYLKSKKS